MFFNVLKDPRKEEFTKKMKIQLLYTQAYADGESVSKFCQPQKFFEASQRNSINLYNLGLV